MCGISGFFTPGSGQRKEEPGGRELLERMNRVLKHRGPDDEGIYLSPECGLAHVRLSILDLERGHQPITKRCGEREVSIVYNGEIYNMRQP